MIQNEAVIPQWAPALLLMELNNILWRNTKDIQIKKLWEYLCTYCYLPRLANKDVLENAIRTGLDSPEYFAFAAAFDGSRYIELKFNQRIDNIEQSGYLVKTSIAQDQLAQEAKQGQQKSTKDGGIMPPGSTERSGIADNPIPANSDNTGSGIPPAPEIPKNKHFYMSAQLDNTRINRDVQRFMEEVVSHLISVDGAQTKISLEVDITIPNGLPHQIVRTVSENCQTLKVQSFGFVE
jgi:hypothetical protein